MAFSMSVAEADNLIQLLNNHISNNYVPFASNFDPIVPMLTLIESGAKRSQCRTQRQHRRNIQFVVAESGFYILLFAHSGLEYTLFDPGQKVCVDSFTERQLRVTIRKFFWFYYKCTTEVVYN